MRDILAYDFLARALAASLLAGALCPAAGVYLVLRRLAFLADALAHVSLAGSGLGLVLGLPPSPCTFSFVLLGALVVERLRAAGRVFGEAALVLVMSTSLALALVLFGLVRGAGQELGSYLFGSLLTVAPGDLKAMLAAATLVAAFLLFFAKELYFISFDEECARAAGLPVGRLNAAFMLAVALAVFVAMKVIGALLVSALMVVPVLTAQLLAGSFRQLFWLSLALGVAVSGGGLVLSCYLGTAPGGTIVLVAAAAFVLAQAGTAGARALRGFGQGAAPRGARRAI
ncbi:metal ABC transporter permease [Desulfovirgula thermocuniculi]|uniref:metal ABC transporter permease n=1 Tax=Desulfovirgula thermocuniculi TaxID=348842 RepID=UPI0003FECCBD|nr:metal ABC transporter permease [Desulfovirgula thermocuniculi]